MHIIHDIVLCLLLLQPQLLHRGVLGVAINMDELLNQTAPPAINMDELLNQTAPPAINMDELLNQTAPPVQEKVLDFSTCYDSDLERTLSKQRLDVFRQEILSKLNLNEVPENPPDDLEIGEDVLASYQSAIVLDGAIEEEREQDGCGEKETFYAKEVMIHFPSQFDGEVPPINIFDWGE